MYASRDDLRRLGVLLPREEPVVAVEQAGVGGNARPSCASRSRAPLWGARTG